MKNSKKTKKDIIKIIIFFIMGGFFVKILSLLKPKHTPSVDDIKENLDDFIEEEGKEIEELVEGEESVEKYCHDSLNIFKDYFIPNDDNDHRPKILRAKPLIIIAVLSILLKFGVLGYLFLIYPNSAKMQQQITTDILVLTNEDRQKNNLPILELNDALSNAAQNKANDMITNNYFSHYGPDGTEPWDWIERDQYAYLNVGENLAMNFTSANAAHLALMDSVSHRNNILNSKYQDIGLAVATGEINGKNTTILVELFGSRETAASTQTIAVSDIIGEEIQIIDSGEKIAVLSSEIESPETKGTSFSQTNEDEGSANLQTIIDPATDNQNSAKTEEEDISEGNTAPAEEEPTNSGSATDMILSNESGEPLNQELIQIAQQNDSKISTASTLIKISKYFYAAMIILIIIFLAINIFVRITIQHKSVILQSILVIIFLIMLLFLKFHILENVIEKITLI